MSSYAAGLSPPDTAEATSLTWAVEVASASPLPLLILEPGTDRILAASRPAISLLSGSGHRHVVGATLASVSYRIPAREVERLLHREVPGYPTTRFIHVDGHLASLELWIRPVDPAHPAGPAFAVVADADGSLPGSQDPATRGAAEALVGSTDRRLLIDRVSNDVSALLGAGPERLLGTSILDLAAPAGVSALLDVLTRASRRGDGAVTRLHLQRPDGGVVPARLAVVPLLPSPSCGFVAVRDDGGGAATRDLEMDRALRRLSRWTGMVSASGYPDSVTLGEFPGRSRLSDRELDVVRQLCSGDRVPAIARGLYLSQSTVRNYLSSVFRKLGVGSQQELLDLIRQPGPPGVS